MTSRLQGRFSATEPQLLPSPLFSSITHDSPSNFRMGFRLTAASCWPQTARRTASRTVTSTSKEHRIFPDSREPSATNSMILNVVTTQRNSFKDSLLFILCLFSFEAIFVFAIICRRRERFLTTVREKKQCECKSDAPTFFKSHVSCVCQLDEQSMASSFLSFQTNFFSVFWTWSVLLLRFSARNVPSNFYVEKKIRTRWFLKKRIKSVLMFRMFFNY